MVMYHFNGVSKPAGGNLRLREHTTNWVGRLQTRWQGFGGNGWDVMNVSEVHPLPHQAFWEVVWNGGSAEDSLQPLFGEGTTMEELSAIAQIVFFKNQCPEDYVRLSQYTTLVYYPRAVGIGRYASQYAWSYVKPELRDPVEDFEIHELRRPIRGVYKVGDRHRERLFARSKHDLAATHEKVLMFHGSSMASVVAIADWGFMGDGDLPFFSSKSWYSMQFAKPWGASSANSSNFSWKAKMLVEAYETLHNMQLLTDLPVPLRSPNAGAILICRVLVPREVAPDASASRNPPDASPYMRQFPAAYCCPDLVVHVEY